MAGTPPRQAEQHGTSGTHLCEATLVAATKR